MTTVTKIAENTVIKSLSHFRQNFVSYDHCCLELLRFFSAHPNSRFSKLAVIHAMEESDSSLAVKKALTKLIGEGVVKIIIENDSFLYFLTGDEPVRQLVLELAKLDWRRWQNMLGLGYAQNMAH
ncbi:MAG: hypothetical protein A2144_09355 [Chloroflexi bacterium RBG_16_50_9]|nr:MAG: hypothetical protein A2144_09355 [Chloroflexi bacterium RBG_16_50_9]